jgi:hypothetical protein
MRDLLLMIKRVNRPEEFVNQGNGRVNGNNQHG